MSRDGEKLYCPVCGSVQDEKNQFCASCGNELKPHEIKSTIKTQTYGSEPQTEYKASKPIPTEGGALVIAVYLAYVGCFTGCFVLPIVGLFLIRTAEKNKEDEKNIKSARKATIFSLILTIIITIGIILGIVLPFVIFM
ncbi:MAG: hypothetical protein ACTSO7_09210 [Candidatus Heimdallarchaeota archaeon]